jgi:hypothetical protein
MRGENRCYGVAEIEQESDAESSNGWREELKESAG